MINKLLWIRLLLLFSIVVIFQRSQAQPLTPISPKNGLVTPSDSILLRWNKMNNATSYQLKYSTDSTFAIGVNTINIGLQLSYWLNNLQSNNTYFWRVDANTPNGIYIGKTSKLTVFKPTDLNGCQLWLRADTGVILNGNYVESWQDCSSNTFVASQATALRKPSYMPNFINGLPALSFDGNDWLMLSNLPFGATVQGFMICRKPNTSTPHGQYLTGPDYNFELTDSSCSVALTGGLVGSFSSTSWNQLSLIRSSGNSAAMLNGNTIGTLNTPLSPILPGNLTIGSRDPALNFASPLVGEISEIVINNSVMSPLQISHTQKYLMDKYSPSLSIGADTVMVNTFCPFTIYATEGFSSYLWSNGNTGQSITVSKSGVYYVTVTDVFNRIQSDTIIVTFPEIQSLNEHILCAGSQLNWNTGLGLPYSFLWQNGNTQSDFQIVQGGNYWVKVTDSLGCSRYSDTAHIVIDNFPNIARLGNDTTLCAGNFIKLINGDSLALNYLWSNGSQHDTVFVTNSGTYWVEVSDSNNCIARDTINVIVSGVAPTANFSAYNVCIGSDIEFHDLSMSAPNDNIIGRAWNFGDGNSSTDLNPIHLYNNPGIYDVFLHIQSASGCGASAHKKVHVAAHPIVDFTITNMCNKQQTEFLNNSNMNGGHIDNISWHFNDPLNPNFVGYGQQISYQYNQTGYYNVLMICQTTEGCTDSLTKKIKIKASPQAAMEHTPTCVGDTAIFKEISSYPFPHYNIYRQWTFNDSIYSNDFQPRMVYSYQGQYSVKLNIVASNGCKDSITRVVTAAHYPIAGFKNDNTCLGVPVKLTDTTQCDSCFINSWLWNVNGITLNNDSVVNYTFPDTGSYNIYLTVKNQIGCLSQAQKNIHINTLPKALIDNTEVFGAAPLEVSLINFSDINLINSWSFGDGSFSNTYQPTHTYNDTGTYHIQLMVTDSFGCKDSAQKSVKVLGNYTDLAIVDAQFTVKDNYVYTEISVLNLGSITIRSFDIYINSDNALLNNSESWQGVLPPGAAKKFKLNTKGNLENETGKTDFACIRLSNVNQGQDDNLSNNTYCSAFESNEFKISLTYPNPADEYVNFALIAPINDIIFAEIIDIKGSIVYSTNAEIMKGYNLLQINTYQLAGGMYNCRIRYKGQNYNQRFIVERNKK